MSRPLATLLLVAALPIGRLAGQTGAPGQIELGAFGVLTKYDDTSVGARTRLGGGARLGLFMSRTFSLEAGGDFTTTNESITATSVDIARVSGTLYAHTRPFAGSTIYIGAGYERLFYTGAINAEDNGGHIIIGDRISFGGRTALRIEGRAAYFPNSPLQLANDRVFNVTASMGISIFAFGGAPRDTDGDQVANRRDQCPDTPHGASVDEVGCPTDEDSDKVFDGLDSCPMTPTGALVDIVGCPSDADSDGVFDGIDVCPETPAGALADSNGCPSDSDADGVLDGLDACADTPAGATVDVTGCPMDSDADGVFDGLDRCPDTPKGVEVDLSGCPADLDSDGVLNTADRCPDTPLGTEVDERGCPVQRDSDGDGVTNDRDRCPNTASGQEVDAVGCPVLFVIKEGRARPLILRGVNFEVGRSALTEGSFATLNEVAASLLANPSVRIEISGHTDSTGSRSLNRRLSQARAQAVRAYLARRSVELSRMVARGYGPDLPVATNKTRDGRAMNRRVELKLLEGGQER